MGANMFYLMAVMVLAILLNTNQFSNFILERSKGIGVVDMQTLSYYGGKVKEICDDTSGTCNGMNGTASLPANSPAIPSIYAAANAYWSGPPGSINEPVSQSPFTIAWASAKSGMSSQSAFVLNDPEGFLPEQIPNVNFKGTVTSATTVYLHFDPCQQGVFASSTASESPSC